MLYSATHVFVSSVYCACEVVAIDLLNSCLLSIFLVQLVTRFSVRLVGKARPSQFLDPDPDLDIEHRFLPLFRTIVHLSTNGPINVSKNP